jgi:hypothetical protein
LLPRRYFITCNSVKSDRISWVKSITNNYFDELFEVPLRELPILPPSLKIVLDVFHEKEDTFTKHEVMLLADKMAIFDLESGNI